MLHRTDGCRKYVSAKADVPLKAEAGDDYARLLMILFEVYKVSDIYQC